jgi:hypothetical protein
MLAAKNGVDLNLLFDALGNGAAGSQCVRMGAALTPGRSATSGHTCCAATRPRPTCSSLRPTRLSQRG